MTGNRWFLTLGELSDASIAGLINSSFELLDCSYSLYQGLDERGRAQTNVRIDGFHLVYDGLPSSEIIDWGLNPRKYYAGAFILSDANNVPQEKIFFEDGACVYFQISYIAEGGSYASTKMTISPRVLKLGDDTLTQPWTLSDVSAYLKNPHTHQQGDVRTSFVISANELVLNDKSLFNDWRV